MNKNNKLKRLKKVFNKIIVSNPKCRKKIYKVNKLFLYVILNSFHFC